MERDGKCSPSLAHERGTLPWYPGAFSRPRALQKLLEHSGEGKGSAVPAPLVKAVERRRRRMQTTATGNGQQGRGAGKSLLSAGICSWAPAKNTLLSIKEAKFSRALSGATAAICRASQPPQLDGAAQGG